MKKKNQRGRNVRTNVSITAEQMAWLKKKKIYSPSRLLQRAIEEMMKKDP